MLKKARILLTGGGSAGHIIPNLAVASAINKQCESAELFYICSRKELDKGILDASGIPFRQIFAGKLRRYFSWQNFLDPFLVMIGFFQSLGIIFRFKPDVVFSKGGYVSLPVVLAAFLLRKPIILHESDSRMGIANRISAKFAKKVCVAFPALVKKGEKYVLTGNPLRKEILEGDKKKGYDITGFDSSKPVLLIWGGSQGSKLINKLLGEDFERFIDFFQVIHITGKGKKLTANCLPLTAKSYKAFEYVGDELKHLYAITDLIVGRAGANSLFEVALLQKLNVVIPLKNADQMNNANYFADNGASLLYDPSQKLFDQCKNLCNNKDIQSSQKKALKRLSQPEAAEAIATMILNHS